MSTPHLPSTCLRLSCLAFLLFGLITTVGCAPRISPETAHVDRSLTLDDYAKNGMPPISHAWTTKEFRTAGSVLDKIRRTDAGTLPRMGSDKSGALYTRLVSVDVLKQINSVPPEKRFVKALEMMSIAAALFGPYSNAKDQGWDYDDEMVDLLRQNVEGTASVMDALRNPPAETKNDPDFPAMSWLLTIMAEAQSNLTVDFLDPAQVKRLEPRRRLALALLQPLPALTTYTYKGRIKNIAATISHFRDLESDPACKSALTDLATRVSATQSK